MSRTYVKISATSCYAGTEATGYAWYDNGSKVDEDYIIQEVENVYYDYVYDEDEEEEIKEENFEISLHIEEITEKEFLGVESLIGIDILVKESDGVIYFRCG